MLYGGGNYDIFSIISTLTHAVGFWVLSFSNTSKTLNFLLLLIVRTNIIKPRLVVGKWKKYVLRCSEVRPNRIDTSPYCSSMEENYFHKNKIKYKFSHFHVNGDNVWSECIQEIESRQEEMVSSSKEVNWMMGKVLF